MRRESLSRDRLLLLALVIALTYLASQAPPLYAAGPGVHGRVFAQEDGGTGLTLVPGALIEFKNQAGQALAKATANKSGYYKVDLPAGTYSYKVHADGFRDENLGRGMVLTLSQGYAVHNFTLVHEKGATDNPPPELPTSALGKLCGQVYEETAGGKLVGIAGACVTLRRKAGGNQVCRVYTRPPDDRANSGFEVVLECGTYQAAVTAEGFEGCVDPVPIEIVADRVTTRDYVLKRPAPPVVVQQGIRCTVIALDPSGMRCALPPSTCVNLTALVNLATQEFRPQTDGTCGADVPVGRYVVSARADGYFPAQVGPVDVFAGRYTFVTLTLIPLPSPPVVELQLGGTICECCPGETHRTPLPGATVRLRKQGETTAAALRATCDAKGHFDFKPAGPGIYDCWATMPGHKPAGQRVEIRTGYNRIELCLEKEMPKLTLNVHVRDGTAKGPAVPQANVFVSQQRVHVATGTSDTGGRCRFDEVTAGMYTVYVSKAGYQPETVDFSLTKPNETCDVVLKRNTTVVAKPPDHPATQPSPPPQTSSSSKNPPPPVLRKVSINLLVREAGQPQVIPIPGCQVSVDDAKKRYLPDKSGTTGRTGRCRVDNLNPGTYTFRVSKEGYESAEVQFELTKPDDEREIALRRSHVITSGQPATGGSDGPIYLPPTIIRPVPVPIPVPMPHPGGPNVRPPLGGTNPPHPGGPSFQPPLGGTNPPRPQPQPQPHPPSTHQKKGYPTPK